MVVSSPSEMRYGDEELFDSLLDDDTFMSIAFEWTWYSSPVDRWNALTLMPGIYVNI